MKAYHAALFDLGNTLIYFDSDWPEVLPEAEQALRQSLQSTGIELASTGFYKKLDARLQAYYAERETEFLEYTTLYVIRSLLAEMGYPAVTEATLRQAVAAMYAVSQAHWQPEVDAVPTLQALRQRGYRLGLVSNAGDDQDVQTLVDKAQLRPYFDVILTSAAQGIRKPNPRIFHTALQALGECPPENAVMVGDTLGADILGAQNTGMTSIWITRRANSAANQAHLDTIQPDISVNTLSELLEVL
jgi:2-haloalkanoic acid dehalogenase type II